MQFTRQSGLVGYWKFNEKSGTVANDSSRYKNHGTLTGSTLPKWQEKGLYFNGSTAYVDCGNKASLNITNAITISVWIYPLGFGGNNLGRVIAKTSAFKTPYRIMLVEGTSTFRFSSDVFVLDAANNSITLNTWNNIIITYNRTSLILYKNSINVGSFSNSTALPSDLSSILYIGQDGITANRFFNGSIDEVRIYNRALNASEIRDLYDSTKHNYR